MREKALLELCRPCRGHLEGQDSLKEKSRAVAITMPHGHNLLLDPGRSKVSLARSETFLSPPGMWLEVPSVPQSLSAGNSMTASSCTNQRDDKEPQGELGCLIKSHFSSPVGLD